MGVLDIAQTRANFHALAVSLQNFDARISGERASYPPEDEQAGETPPSQEALRVILGSMLRLINPEDGVDRGI